MADDALAAALETGELSEAEYALERARSLFELARVRREYGDVARPFGPDATLILRDLAARVGDLAGAERRIAERILARPDDPNPPPGHPPKVPIGDGWTAPESFSSPLCGANVCIHWVDQPGNDDAPAEEDVNPSDGIPDWVNLTLATWEDVWFQEIDTIGYLPPKSDLDSPNNGGDVMLDVYLDDLGSDGVFGYCTSDDPGADPGVYAVSAYCVIDNDFAPEQYGDQHSPQEFLEVTSAHEFHHASQFTYDWLEDYWLMEGTATNIEETVYPEIDDNVFFLRLWSPLTRPGSPLDRGGFGNSEYGSWIFWRYLQEKISGDPSIVREIWERAASAVPDVYSLQAVTQSWRSAADPSGTSSPVSPPPTGSRDYWTPGGPNTPCRRARPRTASGPGHPGDRLAVLGDRPPGLAVPLLLAGRIRAESAKLRVEARLPRTARAQPWSSIRRRRGDDRRLNQRSNGYVRWGAPFGRGSVKRVEVVLSNGSTRVASCWTYPGPPSTSCLGRPLDDRRTFQLRA